MITRYFILLLLVLTVPLTTASAQGNDQLCVQTHFGHPEWGEPLSLMQDAKDLGVGWIRDDLLWRNVEKQKGEYKIPDFAWAWLKEAKEKDLKVIVILNGSNHIYDHPFDPDAYVAFCREMAKQLKGYTHAFELVNEPFGEYRNVLLEHYQHDSATWNGWDVDRQEIEPWVKEYLSMVNSAADAIQEAAPDQYKIISLGCAPSLNAHMIEMGVSPNVDGQVAHPYSHRWIPEIQAFADTSEYLQRDGIIVGDGIGRFNAIYRKMVELAEANNGPTELWLTEQGYTTYSRVAEKPSRYQAFSEHAQAVYAQRRLIEALGIGARLIGWYTLFDRTDDPEGSWGHFGLVRNDGSRKPAFDAIHRIAALMDGWVPEAWGQVDIYPRQDRAPMQALAWDGAQLPDPGVPEFRAYTFTNPQDGSRHVALWSAEPINAELQSRKADVTIMSDRQVTGLTAMNMLDGTTQDVPFKQVGQQVTIEHLAIPDVPVMLALNGDSAVVEVLPQAPEVFDADTEWSVRRSQSTQSSWEMLEDNGVKFGRLIYQFPPTGNAYTGAMVDVEVTPQTPIFAVRVRTPERSRLIFRAVDSTGQIHQFRKLIEPTSDWQSIKIDLEGQRQANYGGANDGNRHYPMKTLSLGIEAFGEVKEGTVEFAELKLLPPAP